MSPAYDRVSTHLLIPRDDLALTVQGKRSDFKRTTWLALAESMGLPSRVATRALDTQAATLDAALGMTRRSALPEDQKRSHADWLRQKTAALAA